MTCHCITEFTNQNGVSRNRSEARLTNDNTLSKKNVSRPSRLSNAAPVGWHVSADLRYLSRCRTSGHTVQEPASRSTAGFGCSQFFSQLRSLCFRTVQTLRAAPPSSRSYLHEGPRLNSSRNHSLLGLFLDLTRLFSRSRRSNNLTIPPFNRTIYPNVQSTNLSYLSIDQFITPFNQPIYSTVQSTNLSHRCHHRCQVPSP